jgi:AcrR family transcriptional regulator
MSDDAKTRFRILKHSEELFNRHSYSAISMSQIAAGLGIGKATIYKYFTNKESILNEIVKSHCSRTSDAIDQIQSSAGKDYFEKLKETAGCIGQNMRHYHKDYLSDIQKNAPDIWNFLEEYRETSVKTRFLALLEEGIQSGFIRSDINQNLVQSILFFSFEQIHDEDIPEKLPFTYEDLFFHTISLFIDGLKIKEQNCKQCKLQITPA